MFWNHRILKRVEQGETVYGIVEAFYDDDGELDAYTESFMAPSGESLEELKSDLKRMLEAAEAPVIDEAEMNAYFEKRRLAGKGLDADPEETIPFDPRMFETTDEALPSEPGEEIGFSSIMKRIVELHVLPGYRLDLVFDDGVRGIVDLSHLVGQGVFEAWRDPRVFGQVSIGSSGELAWPREIDLCPDALYLKVTGKSPEDLFPSLRAESHACERGPLPPVTPGEILREEFLIPLRISRARLSREAGIPLRRIGEIVLGRRSITSDDDLRLGRYLGLSKGYWLRAQMRHDLESAEARLAGELAKIKPWRALDAGEDAFDRAIETDARSGRLDALADEASREHSRGESIELPVEGRPPARPTARRPVPTS